MSVSVVGGSVIRDEKYHKQEIVEQRRNNKEKDKDIVDVGDRRVVVL